MQTAVATRPRSTSARSSPPSIPSSAPPRRCPTDRPRSSRRPAAARRRRWSRAWPCCSPAAFEPDRICVVTFNRDAAQDLAGRVAKRLGPAVPAATSIEVRTLHALARQVLLDAGEGSNIVADRLPLLRAARRRHADGGAIGRAAGGAAARHVALGLEGRGSRAAGRGASPSSRTYAELLPARGAVDFDDLVVRAGDLLETDAALRAPLAVALQPRLRRRVPGRGRRAASPRPAAGRARRTTSSSSATTTRRSTPGGSPTCGGSCASRSDYPAARRVMLATNYRCPRGGRRGVGADGRRQPRALRRSRSARPRRRASNRLRSRRSSTADPSWPPSDGAPRRRPRTAPVARLCFLSRTRGELTPILLALVRRRRPAHDGGPADRRVASRVVELIDGRARVGRPRPPVPRPATAPGGARLGPRQPVRRPARR